MKDNTKLIDMNSATAILVAKNAVWALVCWAYGFLLPVRPFILLLLLLVFADMATGITAAKHRGEAINSKGMRRTVRKIIGYFAAIVCVHGCDFVFEVQKSYGFDMTFSVAALIALTELKSVLENVSSYTGIEIWKNFTDSLPDVKIKDLFKKK